MTNKLKNTQTVLESIRTSLNLVKSTTSNEEEFKQQYKNLLVLIRSEYDKIKGTPYNLSQSDLVSQQYELVKLLAEQVGVKLGSTNKKKSTPKKMIIDGEGIKGLDKDGNTVIEINSDGSVNIKSSEFVNEKWEEVIIVSPRKELFDNERLTQQGVIKDKQIVDEIISNLSNTYTNMRRGAIEDKTDKANNAEINTDFKQPIPYVVLKRDDEIFVYERLVQGGESRLHNKLSLGFGGHCNKVANVELNELLLDNLNRELEEELHIVSPQMDLNYIGLINDDEDEVGRVHLGILATLELGEDVVVEVKEVDQLKGEWMTIEQLSSPEVYDRMENWSKYVIDVLKG